MLRKFDMKDIMLLSRVRHTASQVIIGLIFVGMVSAAFATPVRADGGPGGIGNTDGTSSLQLWLKADAGAYADETCVRALAVNGGDVACWVDQSGHANNVTQGASIYRPNYWTNVVNGEPVLRFDGSDDFLESLDKPTWRFFHDGSEHTAFVIWRTEHENPNSMYYLMGTARSSNDVGFTFGYDDRTAPSIDDRVQHHIMSGSAGNFLIENVSPNGVFEAATFGIATLRFDSSAPDGADVIYVNGASVAVDETVSGDPSSADSRYALGIGANGNGQSPLEGDIAEVIVYTTTLTPLERTHVDLYLMDKYDIDLRGTGIYESGTHNLNVRGISQSADVQESGSSAGLAITDVDFLSGTNDVIVFGHDTVDNVGVLDDLPIGFGSRWSRVWYLLKNDAGDDGGGVRLTFDFGEAGISDTPTGEYYLLRREEAEGDFTPVLTTTTVLGDQVIFEDVDVALLDAYFALGRPPISVTTTDDELNADGDCSLREAVQAANTDSPIGGCNGTSGADVISLSAGDYVLSIPGRSEDLNATGDLDATDVLVIAGVGADLTVIDADEIDRVFDLRPGAGTMIFSGVRITGGDANGNGGGIYDADADLALLNAAVSDNVARDYGGGVYLHQSGSVMTLTGTSAVVHNQAVNGGGVYAYAGTVAVEGGQVATNTASVHGGGIYVGSGSLTMNGGDVHANTAASNGGGIYVSTGDVALNGGEVRHNLANLNGGGVYAVVGGVTLEGGRILSNTATSSGGGVYVSSGSGSFDQMAGGIVAGNAASSGGGVYVAFGSATVAGGDVRENAATRAGGGMYVAFGRGTVSGGRVAGNTSGGDGGGVYVAQSSGTFIQSGTGMLANNSTSEDGGGAYVLQGYAVISGGQILSNTANLNGGGVYVSQGDAVGTGGQIVGNTSNGDGGGIYNTSAMTLTDVSVFANVGGAGGGIYNAGVMTLGGVHIYENAASAYGGGMFNQAGGLLALSGSVVSTNTTTGAGGGVASFTATLAISGSQILGNVADYGGGLYLLDSDDADLSANIIFDNVASQDGGGLYLRDSDALLVNNVLADNHADGEGAGLYTHQPSHPQFLHNTLAHNTGGTGIYVDGSTAVFANTIIVTHTTGIHVAAGSASLEATLWDSNVTDMSGVNVVSDDDREGSPAFEDAANDDYHIIPWLSAATDAGMDAGIGVDFDGAARPQGADFDIGAFEGPETGLALVKTAVLPIGSAVVVPGQRITYTLVYTNHGPGVADGVLITDLIDTAGIDNFGFANTGPAITPTGSLSYTWLVEDLAPGDGGVIVITGDVAMGLPNGYVITNTAAITTVTPTESIPENNTDEVVATVKIVVSTTDDELIDDGDCSLREAIQAANTDAAVDACAAGAGADTIILLADTYVLSLAGTDEDLNATGDLDVSDALSLVGAGAAQTMIDASGLITPDRVLDIRPGTGWVVISGTAIVNGSVTGDGGGVYNADAELTLANAEIRDCVAGGAGGGVYVGSGGVTLDGGQIAGNAASDGGGVYFDSDGTLSGGQVFNNTAASGGGIGVGTGGVTLSGGQIVSNAATLGGGVYVYTGTATLSGGEVVHNAADTSGGGVYVDRPGAVFTLDSAGIVAYNTAGNGGGLSVGGGAASLDGGQILANTASADGGAVYNASGAITQTVTQTVTGDVYQAGGTFHGSGDAGNRLALYGSLSLAGGTFVAPAGALSISGDFAHTGGAFTHNGGEVILNGSAAQSISGSNTFYDLTVDNSSAGDRVDASGSGNALAVDHRLHVQDGIFVSASDLHTVQMENGATLELGGDVTVSGDWANEGVFVPNGHAVVFDGGDQSIVGSTTFYALTKHTTGAAILTFAAGSTQTVVSALDLQGESGNLLALRSSVAGTHWHVDPQGSRTVAYLDVQDSHNVNDVVIAAHATHNVDSGNNPGWNLHFPVADEATFTIDEDEVVRDRVIASDLDTGDVLIYGVLVEPITGTVAVTDTATGRFVYTPTNQVATYVDTFTGVVTDVGGLTDTAVITVVVAADDDPPIAHDDGGAGYTTDEDTPLTTDDVLANDVDVDTPTLSVVSTGGTLGMIFYNGDGTFSFDPRGMFDRLAAGEQDVITFTYDVSDGHSTDTATVTITIDGVNDPPEAHDDEGAGYVTDEDTAFTTANVLDNDVERDLSDSLTVVSVDTGGVVGLIADNGDGTFDYDPQGQFEHLAVGEQGFEVFAYVVSDGVVTDTATVTITVDGVNDPPVAYDDDYIVAYETPLTVPAAAGVLANDLDVDGGALTATLDDGPTGTLTLAPDGDFVYTPTAGFTGPDTFIYHASDGYTDSNAATVTINVLHSTEADLEVSKTVDNLTPNEGDTAVYSLRVSNTGLTDTTGVVVSDVLPSGVIYVADDGDGTYDESAGAWTIGDLNDGDSAAHHITVTVGPGTAGTAITNTAAISASDRVDPVPGNNEAEATMVVNAPPEAHDDEGSGYTTDEDTAFTTGNVLDNDVDPDAAAVPSFVSVDTGATVGLVSYNGDGTFDYDPNGQFEGLALGDQALDTFTYVVADVGGLTDTATVTIAVDGVNDPPIAHDDGGAGYTTDEDTPLTTDDVLANDVDVDTPTLSVVSTGGTLGMIFYNGDGTFNFDPRGMFDRLAAGEQDVITFTYDVSDGHVIDTATVTITIEGVNDPPEARDDEGAGYVTDEDTAFTTADVLDNDVERDLSDGLTVVSIITDSVVGLIADNGDGTFDYDPQGQFEHLAVGEQGFEVFAYVVSDGVVTDTATVTITVDGVNDPPVAYDDDYIVAYETTLSVPAVGVLANDLDVDGGALTAVLDEEPVGTLTLAPDGGFVYTPPIGFGGVDVFTYHASDGYADSNVVTVTINVLLPTDADLALNKDVDIPTPKEGDDIVYTLQVINGGPADATGVVISDVLPSGVTYVADDGEGTYDESTGAWVVGAVGSGESTLLHITARVNVGMAGMTITNTAAITALDQIDPIAENDIAQAGVTVLTPTAADLAVVKEVDESAPDEGDTVVYTLWVLNNGPADATGVVISDVLPSGVTYVADDGAGAYDVDVGTWIVGTLDRGVSTTLRLTVTVDAGTRGNTIVNTAAISASHQPDPIAGNDSAEAVVTINDRPIANDDYGWEYITDEDAAFTTGNVLDNDTDDGGDGVLFVVGVDPSDITGLLTNNDDGTFTYDPNGQFEFLAVGEQGFESFTYTVSDAGGLTDTAIVTITVNGLNDPPVANDDDGMDYTTDKDTPFTTGNVLDNDTDPDDADALAVVSVDTGGTLGQVADNGDGTFDYDPAGQFAYLGAGEWAVDTFTYAAGDGLKSDTAVVTITITSGINNPPTISNILDQVVPVNGVLGPVPFTVQDQETPADDLTLSAVSSNTALVPSDAIFLGGAGISRTVVITPTADQMGATVITITVSDGEDTAEDAFELRVVEHMLYLPLVVRDAS